MREEKGGGGGGEGRGEEGREEIRPGPEVL
jgi:hypothetical protein